MRVDLNAGHVDCNQSGGMGCLRGPWKRTSVKTTSTHKICSRLSAFSESLFISLMFILFQFNLGILGKKSPLKIKRCLLFRKIPKAALEMIKPRRTGSPAVVLLKTNNLVGGLKNQERIRILHCLISCTVPRQKKTHPTQTNTTKRILSRG